MGDLFRREATRSPAPFTGERLTGAATGQVEVEHYHRYLFARALVDGRDVLDVASGEGYGAAQLAQVARSVVGVEFDPGSVGGAAQAFPRPNLWFCRGDARALPLADRSIDAVVSFETIEHFSGQELFLAEVKRVLRPDGIVVMSTPDRDVYSGAHSPANPFHVKELTSHEFLGLLQARFRTVSLLRQRAVVGSALLADDGAAGSPLVFERRGEHGFEACGGLPRAPYLLAVASDAALPPLPPSLYIERSDLDPSTRELAEARAGLAAAQQRIAVLEERDAALVASVTDVRAVLETMQATAMDAEKRAAAAQERAAASEAARIAAIAEGRHAVAAACLELETVRGSARHFLRQYLPRLRRHWFG